MKVSMGVNVALAWSLFECKCTLSQCQRTVAAAVAVAGFSMALYHVEMDQQLSPSASRFLSLSLSLSLFLFLDCYELIPPHMAGTVSLFCSSSIPEKTAFCVFTYFNNSANNFQLSLLKRLQMLGGNCYRSIRQQLRSVSSHAGSCDFGSNIHHVTFCLSLSAAAQNMFLWLSG